MKLLLALAIAAFIATHQTDAGGSTFWPSSSITTQPPPSSSRRTTPAKVNLNALTASINKALVELDKLVAAASKTLNAAIDRCTSSMRRYLSTTRDLPQSAIDQVNAAIARFELFRPSGPAAGGRGRALGSAECEWIATNTERVKMALADLESRIESGNLNVAYAQEQIAILQSQVDQGENVDNSQWAIEQYQTYLSAMSEYLNPLVNERVTLTSELNGLVAFVETYECQTTVVGGGDPCGEF
jgi:ATP-dependent Clp protease ATP-binding subunit ClpA